LIGGALAVAGAVMLGGCGLFHHDGDKTPAQVQAGPLPSYADAARQYNGAIRYLDRMNARVNILQTFFDEQGKERHEDPEGRLQMVRPDRLALSLGKAGQTLFWFGCDGERYWWLDLSGQPRIAAVGQHELFDDATAKRVGVPVKPLDLIRLLGVVPMDPAAAGATQWSSDGTLLGITGPVGDRGFQRTWVNPKTYLPVTVEIFDRARQKVLVADHTGTEPVEFTRDMPGVEIWKVRAPSRVEVTHLATKTKLRITFTGVKDGPVSEQAFDLKTLLEKFPVDKVIDLDAKNE